MMHNFSLSIVFIINYNALSVTNVIWSITHGKDGKRFVAVLAHLESNGSFV